jgi:DNA invertase Pin-like site-specific DNA recombinase
MSANAERNAEIIRRRKAGEGPAEIAFGLNITRQTVSGVLFRAGMTKPTRGRGNGATDEVKRLAVEMLKTDTYHNVGRAFGVTGSAVHNWRRNLSAA